MKKILFLLIIVLQTYTHNEQDRIKLYAIYTASHEVFLRKWFFPSLKDNYKLILKQYHQTDPDGTSSILKLNQNEKTLTPRKEIIKSKFRLPGDSLSFPGEDIVLHHATCTRGVQNKIKQLEYVKRAIQDKNPRFGLLLTSIPYPLPTFSVIYKATY